QRALRAFLDNNCQSHGIKPGTADHKDLSDRLMALWNAGFDLKAIKRLLFPDRPSLLRTTEISIGVIRRIPSWPIVGRSALTVIGTALAATSIGGPSSCLHLGK